MSDTMTNGSMTWREGRRFRAWELDQEGWKVGHIAAALGVTHGAVSQWLQRAREKGVTALARHPPPGRTPRLTPEQQAKVPDLLRRGAEAWGFQGERWTRQRVAAVLKREFGVAYHPAHVSRLLAKWGWTLQKPARQARQRDEAQIREWREQTWPALEKRGPRKAGRWSLSTKPASNCCPR
jgi:transposase